VIRPRIPILARSVAIASWLTFSIAAAQEVPAWKLVWSDEFNGPSGSAPDATRWVYDVGGHGWGNNELQYYTLDRRENARVEDGCLAIEARREAYRAGNTTWDYTSARLKTQTKAHWTYGRIEARMQIPRGQGFWPAFWMLGADYPSVVWPNCGEIDIMENIGAEPTVIHGGVHGPGYSGGDGLSRAFILYDGTVFADRFHLYAVEWEPGFIRWSVDNKTYFLLTPANLTSGQTWVFDRPFFLLLNLAVGGNWPGSPDSTTVFPQCLRVDYVRVYTRTTAPAPTLQIYSTPNATCVSWPGSFPGGRLQQARFLGATWFDVPIQGTLLDDRFVTEATAGIFRLR
jgi:beta-glucanase (GH16 family)